MDYRSTADLSADIALWAERLPRDFELVVGVPRSGLLAANLLALHLNLPLTDVDGLIAGRVMTAGPRCPSRDLEHLLTKHRKILVVDDSLWSGATMKRVKEATRNVTARHEIHYGAVYVISANAGRRVDHFFTVLSAQPRVFEWNLMHHEVLSASCVDIDGVLCRNPLPEENDGGSRYQEFLTCVEPCVRPGKRIATIVTSRLERYRPVTEEWLRRNKIDFDRLVMLTLPDGTSPATVEARAAFKARVFQESGAVVFVESSLEEAVEIARISGRDVISMEGRRLVRPNPVRRQRRLLSRAVSLAISDPRALLQRVSGRLKRWAP